MIMEWLLWLNNLRELNETANICSTHHLNLVRLVAFCFEGKHMFWYHVHEKGSLEGFGHHFFLVWGSFY